MVTVRVPATTANLGPGFDTLGLALALYNTLTFEELPQGLFFEGVEPEYATVEKLAVVSYKAVLSKLGLPMPGLRISIQAEIPICRGLGSSAAPFPGGAAGRVQRHRGPPGQPGPRHLRRPGRLLCGKRAALYRPVQPA